MSWRIIYIQESEKIKLFLDNLVIMNFNSEYKIPLSDINTICLEDNKTIITVKLINKISKYDITFIICDDKKMPSEIILPISGHHQHSHMSKQQIKWTKKQKAFLWQQIVKCKIENQIDVLKYNDLSNEKIKLLIKYVEEVKYNDLGNREGHSAKVYFNELFGLNFKRNDQNPINGGLNFGYTILRSSICRILISRGLNPCFGIFHHNKNNAFLLADDIIEVFRPLVDNWVYNNMRDSKFLSKEDKVQLVNLLNYKVIIENKHQFLVNAINIFIDNIINYFETNIFKKDMFPILDFNFFYEL